MSTTGTAPLPHNWDAVFSTTGGDDPTLLQELHRSPDLEAAIAFARTSAIQSVAVMKRRHSTLEWVPWREGYPPWRAPAPGSPSTPSLPLLASAASSPPVDAISPSSTFFRAPRGWLSPDPS